MTKPESDDELRRRRETLERDDATSADGLARATRGLQSGEDVADADDSADGE